MLDPANFLENYLQNLSAHFVTNVFLITISFLFVLSLVFLYRGEQKSFTSHTASLLTSIGILGTFIGIVIGLLDFDPKKIDESIELLLNGLKTAFITSLAGMASAIFFKIFSATKYNKENRLPDEIIDVEPRDILKAINNQEQHLVDLRKAISDNDESSLVGQIKLLRGDSSDQHKAQQLMFENFSTELWKNLQEFSEMLSKSATEQVIQALKEVITDFNKNLTEQFGDNFKALDSSVKRLVDWQAQYSLQLKQMSDHYAQGVKAISDIEQSVSSINEESKAIPQTMSELKSVLEVNQHQINELSRHLEAFKEMKEKATNALPEIQKNVDDTIKNITLSAQAASDGYQSLLKSTENIHGSFTHSIEGIQKQLETTINELTAKQTQEMNNAFNALEKEVANSVETTGKAVNKHLEMIDESMTQEVTRVMTEMGRALASISGQFTKDYQDLTLAMKKVTNTART